MDLSIQKHIFRGLFALLLFLSCAELVHAQTSTSTGRSNVVTQSMNNNDYKAIKRIRTQINEGKFDKAVRGANKIIRAEDRRRRSGETVSEFYLEAYNGLCVSLTGLGNIEEAMEACNKSIDLSPGQWESLKSRATLHYMAQDFSRSLEDFNLSLENAPDDEAIVNVLKQNIGVVKSKVN